MDCMVVGDSIAVGVGQYLHAFHDCVVDAAIGISAGQVIGRVRDADFLVVSAGANNPHDPKLVEQLEALRSKARRRTPDGKPVRVVWIAPAHERAAHAVMTVAARHGDAVIRIGFGPGDVRPGPDGVHPASYPELAAAVASRF